MVVVGRQAAVACQSSDKIKRGSQTRPKNCDKEYITV